jgi:hypothetical protein
MKIKAGSFFFAFTSVALFLAGCSSEQSEVPAAGNTSGGADLQAIATEAYIYGFPLMMGYKTLYSYVVDEQHPEYKGPFNQLACTARLFTPDDKAVVTPNADTPYCMTWLDLRAEPLVLTVPELEPERYYSFQLIDLYTHNFDYVGTLTTGNGAGQFLIAGPGWDGMQPEGVDRVIRSETDFILSVTRTQLFSPDDLERVTEIQQSYALVPLSGFLGNPAPDSPADPDFPVWVEGAQFDERSFAYIDFLLDQLRVPPPGEEALWQGFASIGLGPGQDFDLGSASPEMQEDLRAAAAAGFAEIEQFIREVGNDPLASAKIFGTRQALEESARSNFGQENIYLLRAAAGHQGLYGLSASEAVYPSYLVQPDGRPYDGSQASYLVSFAAGQLPPARAFWSLTMYDGRTQLFVPNPLDRYLLNSTMLDDFVFEDDGSLVFTISNDPPAPDRMANWLPAPDGPFYMVMRVYGPEAEVLSGEWQPPAITEAE